MVDAGLEVRLQNRKNITLNITLQCSPGEVLALVGPSGSGKTTALRSIAGLFTPQQGVVRVNGQVWLDSEQGINMPAYQRKVGLVFQEYALFPHYTALQNVAAALPDMSQEQRESQALSLLSKVHLAGLQERYPHQLSGGQQQRVAMARALAREPDVIMLDEPFSAVDQVTRRRLYRELSELRRTLSTPMILVTHDLEEASMLADRLCLLHRGVSLQCGPPLQVAAHPVSPLVAKLMDQHNLFSATVINHDRQRKLTWILWRGISLEAKYQPDFQENSKVSWMIQSANVLLHRRFRKSNGERENPLSGKIIDYLLMGGYVVVQIALSGQSSACIEMSVPVHVARRNSLQLGEIVTVSLLAEHIHLMPYEKLPKDRMNAGEIAPY